MFGIMLLIFIFKSAITGAMLKCQILQGALATLITNRAIERMTGEQEFQYIFTCITYHCGLGAHGHPFTNRGGAGRVQFWLPCNHYDPFVILDHLTCGRVHLGRANFNQAHTAHPYRLKLGVIAKHGNIILNGFCSIHNERAFGHGNGFAVDG